MKEIFRPFFGSFYAQFSIKNSFPNAVSFHFDFDKKYCERVYNFYLSFFGNRKSKKYPETEKNFGPLPKFFSNT